MTRKHFKAIAAALKASDADMIVVIEVASALSRLNANFKTERFVSAATHK